MRFSGAVGKTDGRQDKSTDCRPVYVVWLDWYFLDIHGAPLPALLPTPQ